MIVFFKRLRGLMRVARANWTRWAACGLAGFAIGALTLGDGVAQKQGAPTPDRCKQDATSGGCELILPRVCSRDPAASTAPPAYCKVTDLPDAPGFKRVQVNLKAQTAKVRIGGYSVETENYNGMYLPPVIEALAGDTVAAELENWLKPRTPSGSHGGHAGAAKDNPTNLHFFHGGVVKPNNARRPNDPADDAALLGDGDNIFTYLKPKAPPFIYKVPIPLALDGRVLELPGVKTIPHPSGLNWYHSHLHGWSSDQVMGGLSGLLSVGYGNANVVACAADPRDKSKCLGDKRANDNATEDLRKRTDVRYALLRDIALQNISALPESDEMDKTATWDRKLQSQTSDLTEGVSDKCYVWLESGGKSDDPNLRKGYCQHDKKTAWLFTVNGQRFPTVKVEGGRNLLLRLGNLSANVAYWLELNEQDESGKKQLKQLLLLSFDGVVPARPVDAEADKQPVLATAVEELVLLPASRAEIYIRNDRLRSKKATYILRTKGLIAGNVNDFNDRWPEVQLMRIELQPNAVANEAEVALNAVTGVPKLVDAALAKKADRVVEKPEGCVDDIDPALAEHRRVTFLDGGATSDGKRTTRWSVRTEIVRPPGGPSSPPVPYSQFIADDNKTVGIKRGGRFEGMPFEEYDLGGGRIDWSGKTRRVCVFVDPENPEHKGGLKQLWVLHNDTADLHNFHIHQMKFRLATAKELEGYKIKLDDQQEPEPSEVCFDGSQLVEEAPCKGPIYKLYDKGPRAENTKWHDTIPLPPNRRVYVIMSFVAEEQIGRYVFHCHVLKHEDNGLMAPIEVWKPTSGGIRQ